MKTLIRLLGSCCLVGLKCYEDSDQTAWIVLSCMTEMLWRLWSDCLDRAVLYDWNVMKNDQIAWIMQSCRTEMLWSLIRLHGSCSLVELKCYDDSDQTALIVQSCGTEIIGRLRSECVDRACLVEWKCYEDWSDCVDRAVCRTELLWRLWSDSDYDWNAIKTDQTAWSCSLVALNFYEDWSDCLDRGIL